MLLLHVLMLLLRMLAHSADDLCIFTIYLLLCFEACIVDM